MDVYKILEEHVKSVGGVGLYEADECGCGLDDFIPCGQPHLGCRVAFLKAECEIHGEYYGDKNSNNTCPECDD